MFGLGKKHAPSADDIPSLKTSKLASLDLLAERTAPAEAGAIRLLYLLVVIQFVRSIWSKDGPGYQYGWYGLYSAIAVQLGVKLLKAWFVPLKVLSGFVPCRALKYATHVKVRSADHTGRHEVVRLEVREFEAEAECSFEFRKQRFCWDAEDNGFHKLRCPTKGTFKEYAGKGGFKTQSAASEAFAKHGRNTFEVPTPMFGELLAEQLMAPFFVFQVLCVGLWCLDEYVYYSLFTLGMLVVFECTTVFQRMRHLNELRALQTPKQALQVYREGKWDQLPGDAIVPGDLVSIGRPSGAGAEARVVPADMLLLAGTCIVEEAVLTGESHPQWKTPVGNLGAGPAAPAAEDGEEVAESSGVSPQQQLRMKRDRALVLFGGTRILQHTPDKHARIKTPDGGCLAYVLRTGFETAQGRLMRTILYSTERVTGNNWEVGMFILFLLIFAIAASYYVLHFALQDPYRDRFKLYLHCTMIITAVVPPELPMELSMAVNASLLALIRKFVVCTEPFRIPLAGKIDVCCFDKTGTLTSDEMVLQGILPPRGGSPQPRGDHAAQRILAACQSLILVEGKYVGDPLETTVFEASGWSQDKGVLRSPKNGVNETATILRRFHFSSSLKRMSCIVKVERGGSSAPEYHVLAKGAPEVVQDHLAASSSSYASVYKEYAAQGARVLALAHRKLPGDTTAAAVRGMPREEAESQLQLAGFAVLQCPLKPESEPALAALAESSHQLVMITGDAALTACHAAAQVHITDRPVLILAHRGNPNADLASASGQDSDYGWSSPDEATSRPFSRDPAEVLDLASQHDLCVVGDALRHLTATGAERLFIPLIQVFARTAPEQKELVLRTLRAAGMTTLMCGDGTNDVGALKAAHVGVAVLAPRPGALNAPGQAPAAGQGPPRPQNPWAAARAQAEERAARAAGRGRGRDMQLAGRPGGVSAEPAKGGPGTDMLDKMRKAGKPVTPQMERMAAALDGMGVDDGQVPMVRPGDASMASPFTARAGSVAPCCDIIRQGRTTLVTTVQMFKILGLLCLSTAYSLSVQYLQGIKLGDFQATVSAFISAGLFFVISSAKPLDRLSPQRPHPNIFCAYVFVSMLGQFALHTAFLIFVYNGAVAIMPKDQQQAPDADFAPNLVNTVCWLINFITQLITFAVNYMGEPFNTSITTNRGLWGVVRFGSLAYVILVLDLVPGFASGIALVPVPQPLCAQMLALAAADAVLSFGLEHGLRRLLPAPRPVAKGYVALQASQEAAQRGTAEATRRKKGL